MSEKEKKELESEAITEAAAPEASDDDSMYVKFRKPYEFEGETYKGVDLSGLETLSGLDMIATQREMERQGHFSTLPELTLEYACIICSRATELPREFFQRLPMKDATRLKNKVTNFFYGTDGE